MAKQDLDELGPVKKPLSWPAAVLTGKKFIDEAPGIDSMGIWECSPGRWERTIMQEEFAHFVKGSARFIPTHGVPIDIHAGDTIWFPANSTGVWEISEDVRKVYVIIDRPSFWQRLKASIRLPWKSWSEPSGLPVASAATGSAAEPALVWHAEPRKT
ncbi:MAG: DUF861 domain-containing protein [Alphaproteobacteria bacterium]|nr:DUF861 domain-containing protein [Alphaproteobacteria bacterium]